MRSSVSDYMMTVRDILLLPPENLVIVLQAVRQMVVIVHRINEVGGAKVIVRTA